MRWAELTLNALNRSCTKCRGAPSVYHRPYSGERLCASCFNESLFERVKKTVGKYDMFEYDSRIAVGVSGGKDSLAMLRLLHRLERDRNVARRRQCSDNMFHSPTDIWDTASSSWRK